MYDLFASPSVTGPVIPVQSEADIPLANEQIELLNDDVTLILPKDATPTQIDEFEDKIDKINPDYKTCQNADNVNLTESCNATFRVVIIVGKFGALPSPSPPSICDKVSPLQGHRGT